MNKEIKIIEQKIKDIEYCNGKISEELFDVGVELGRLLEKNSVEKYRLQLFVDKDNVKNKTISKRKEKKDKMKDIDEALSCRAVSAIIEMIDKSDEFILSSVKAVTDEFTSDIANKYEMNIKEVKLVNGGDHFKLNFSFSGDIKELLDKLDIGQYFCCYILNRDEDGVGTGTGTDIYFDKDEFIADDCECYLELFGKDLDGLDAEILGDIASECNKEIVWAALKQNVS